LPTNDSGIASYEGKDGRGGTWGWNIQAGMTWNRGLAVEF